MGRCSKGWESSWAGRALDVTPSRLTTGVWTSLEMSSEGLSSLLCLKTRRNWWNLSQGWLVKCWRGKISENLLCSLGNVIYPFLQDTILGILSEVLGKNVDNRGQCFSVLCEFNGPITSGLGLPPKDGFTTHGTWLVTCIIDLFWIGNKAYESLLPSILANLP